MARYGLIADIHGNLAALEAALAALEAHGVDEILCLGDIVGYNAEPNECIASLRARGILCIAGNHDRIAAGQLGSARCANKVIYALRRTRRVLTASSRAFLRALPQDHVRAEEGFVLLHAGVDDVERYLRTPADIRIEAERFRQRYCGIGICFFGHVHEQCVYEVSCTGEVTRLPAVPQRLTAAGRLYFVNPGSVDAARKPLAEQGLAQCAIYDTAVRGIEFLAIPYDHAKSERRAHAQGYRIGPKMAALYRWRRQIARQGARLRQWLMESGRTSGDGD